MLIVFDWDGTLADSTAHIVAAMQQAITTLGLDPVSDAQCASKIGLGLRETVLSLYPGIDEQLALAFCQSYSDSFVALVDQGFSLTMFDGVIDTLETLKSEGHKLAVATGKSRRGLNRVLAESNLSDYFIATRTADETASKPDPMMLNELLSELQVEADQSIMIGDTSYDLAMANAAQVRSVGVTCGVHTVEELLAHKPLTLLDSVAELPGYLKI